MKGKVVSYDEKKGKGKILIKNKGVFVFDIENWLDYDNLPSISEEVQFDFEDGKIVDIVSTQNTKSLFNELNNIGEIVIPTNLSIKTTVSLNKCIEDFFDKYKNIAQKYKYLLDEKKSIPFKKVKRFLFTAYNNLVEIDPQINDKHLKEVKTILNDIDYNYDSLTQISKNPIYTNLEKIVLNKQENYVITKKRFEKNKELSVETTKNANLLEPKIEKLSNSLKNLSQKSPQYKEIEEKLKILKRKYVDLIDFAQTLKEENSKIIDSIKEFENFYKDLFEKFFKKESKIILKILENELNKAAYKFDTLLWENAKKSQTIQHFFNEAKIEGSYSTKTFMKYYLKSLNNNKINDKDKELLEVFEELKSLSKNIVIYDANRNRAREFATYAENLDHDCDVKIFDNLKDFIFYIQENSSLVDIACIYISQHNKVIIPKILALLKKVDIDTLLYSDEIEEENIIKINDVKHQLKILM